jgi:hypothetical protein
VHDTVDLEARGVPSLFVATTEFVDGAELQAKQLGADPAAVYVPHPIQDRTDAELRQLADDALAEVLVKLVKNQALASGARS